MRSGSYAMLVGLLQASTKGINPLKLQRFENSKTTAEGELDRNSTSQTASMEYKQTLLGFVDPATVSAAIQLNDWINRNGVLMSQAMEMFRLDLYGLDKVRPIGSLCRLYQW